MKVLLFIFLITRSQQYFFDRLTQNETDMDDNRLQAFYKSSEKNSIRSMMSNKVLVISIACLSIVVIATVLTVYFTKDQIKDFINRMSLNHRGPVIHQFHQEVQEKPTHDVLSINAKSINESGKRERTSVHAFMNSSIKHQQDSMTDYRQSQSAANLFLYH